MFGHFRDQPIAASLKPACPGRIRPLLRYFRDQPIAASLKLIKISLHRVRVLNFRDQPIAASLKQGAGAAPMPGDATFPRSADRGIIEAMEG